MTVEGNARTATSTSFPQLCRSHDGTYDVGWVAQLPEATLTPNVFIFRQDVATKATQTFDLSTIVNNPFNMPLQGDGHFTMAVISDADNLVHVVGNLHADPLDGPGTQRHYGYTTWPPNTSTSWTFPAWSSLPFASTGLSNAHTYFQWTRNTAGDLIAFNDQEDQAVHYVRAWILTKLPAHSTTWQFVDPANKLLTSGVPSATATPDPGTANRIYSKLTLVGDRLHCTSMFADVTEATSGFWRQEHTYMWSDPPYTTWRAADGTVITLPLTWANRTPALIGVRPPFSTEQSPQVAVNDRNYPYVTFNQVNSSGTQVSGAGQWYQCYWDGSAWQANQLSSGTGPPQAGPSYPGNVWWNGQLWTMHNISGANKGDSQSRFRLYNRTTGATINIGGAADTHMTPYPDPIATRDRARPRFLIPDGNNPLVYEFMPPVKL